MKIENFFSDAEKKAIQKAIADAELNTSGEIRVHIDRTCSGDPVKSAIELFEQLNMHQTEQRNGVLFYLALETKKFAIVGDTGIDQIVATDFWDSIKETVITHFKAQQFTEGLCEGIRMAGEKLKEHFPFQKGDTNELSDEISFQQ